MLNVLDIISEFHTVTRFAIVNILHTFHTKAIGIFIPKQNTTCPAPMTHQVSPSNRKLNLDITHLPCCFTSPVHRLGLQTYFKLFYILQKIIITKIISVHDLLPQKCSGSYAISTNVILFDIKCFNLL
jgi:hypothetical protein